MVLNLDRCIGCYTCVVACKMCYGTKPGVNYNGVVPVEWGDYPNARQRYQLPMCMHCENAPCVAACPLKAIYTSEEGAVLIDYDKCDGCGECVTACPYDACTLVQDEATYYPGVVMPHEEEASNRLNLVEKCTFCYGRAQNGEQPMCTVHCPGYSRIFGDVDDPESEISKYIAEKKAVHVEGTSIWYVAPADMPAEFLPKSPTEAAKAKAQAKSEG